MLAVYEKKTFWLVNFCTTFLSTLSAIIISINYLLFFAILKILPILNNYDNFSPYFTDLGIIGFGFFTRFGFTDLNLYFFIKFFMSKYLYNLNICDLSNITLTSLNNYLNYPIFIFFGMFFFLTTIFSLLSLSFTGLYGTFVLNLISLTILWLSLLPYVEDIFSKNLYYHVTFGKWMYLTHTYKVSFSFLIDTVSLSFSFLTLTIALFVYIYTFSYFRYEPLVDRLVLFLNAFIISMVFLVSSGNFINLFLGWELIGLTSFFLINFWSTRVGTLKAAFKAYSFNKTSDLFLFVVIVLIFNTTFNLDICTFINTIHLYENYSILILNYHFNYLELISVLFLVCAFIKSAQFGAHI